MLNENLTKGDADWLVNVFAPKMSYRIDDSTMSTLFIPARNLLTGKQNSKPSCGCHFKAFAQITNSMYSQFENEIKAIANG